jgi:hypothetical protein
MIRCNGGCRKRRATCGTRTPAEHCCSPDQGQLRSIREYNGVDKVALQQVRALPDWHPDWDRQNDHTNLDVLGTDQAHSEHQASPLASKASVVCDAGE